MTDDIPSKIGEARSLPSTRAKVTQKRGVEGVLGQRELSLRMVLKTWERKRGDPYIPKVALPSYWSRRKGGALNRSKKYKHTGRMLTPNL